MVYLLRSGFFLLAWTGCGGDSPVASIRLRRQRVPTFANKGRAATGSGGRVSKAITVPFLVWTQSRSGSEWFMSRLSMHSNICSSQFNCSMCQTESMRFGALIEPATPPGGENCIVRNFWSTNSLGGGGSTIDAKKVFETYVEDLFGGQLVPPDWPVGTTAVGYKFASAYMQNYKDEFGLSAADVMETMKQLGLRAVVLYRENKLDQYISGVIAETTGVWHINQTTSQTDKDKVNDLRLTVDTQKLLNMIRRTQASHRQALELLNKYAIDSMAVTYEVCVNQLEQCLCSVSKFLGLPCEDIAATGIQLSKSNIVSHRERITNFDQVAEALSNNGFGSFLE